MKRSTEYLLVFYESNGPLRLRDVAKKLKVTMPSALEVINKLAKEGYLVKVGRGKYEISEKGRRCMYELIWRHAVLEWTFMEKLNIKDSRICEAISKFEDSIPREIIEELCELNKHPEICPHDLEVPHPGSERNLKYKYCKV